jgi:hypothetical protein
MNHSAAYHIARKNGPWRVLMIPTEATLVARPVGLDLYVV